MILNFLKNKQKINKYYFVYLRCKLNIKKFDVYDYLSTCCKLLWKAVLIQMLIFVMNEDDLMQLSFKWILYVTCVFNRLRMIFIWYKNPT